MKEDPMHLDWDMSTETKNTRFLVKSDLQRAQEYIFSPVIDVVMK